MATEAAPSHVVASGLDAIGASVTLCPGESHYLVRVCRVRAGDRVTATDGQGARATLRVVAAGPPVLAEIEEIDRATRRRQAWLLCGPPQGERADWLVEKLAELGVSVVQPLECERRGWSQAGRRMDRWRRLARAALRQSLGRFELQLREPMAVPAALNELPVDAERWLADPGGVTAGDVRPALAGVSVGAVGPASGFSPAELELFDVRGFRSMALAASRLRTETAALAWASWWAACAAAP